MKKIFNTLLILLTLILFISLNVNAKTTIDYDYSGYRDSLGNWVLTNYESTYDESYYDSLSGITEKNAFISALSSLIVSTRTVDLQYHSYSSGNYSYTGTVIADADEDPTNHDNVICIYTGASYPKNTANSNWNIEHIWPQSHNVTGERKDDIHHLRACNMSANSARGNADFCDLESGNSYGSNKNGYDDVTLVNGAKCDPRDSVKGDIARMLFYMDMMYPELELVSDMPTSGKYLANIDCLKKWHEQDPVDDMERRRNDVVEYYQGNRNPFIDHPEYANIVFGTNYVVKDDNNNNGYTVTYMAGDSIFNYTDTTVYEAGSKINKPSVDPVLVGYKFMGWVDALSSSLTNYWNFSSDVIHRNIVLRAVFIWDGTLTGLVNKLESKASISFDYKKEVTEAADEPELKEIAVSPVGGSGALNPSANQDIDVTDLFGLADFNVILHSEGKNAAYVKPGEFRLYNCSGNGTKIEFIVKNNDSQIESVELENTNIEVKIASDKKSFTIQNITPDKTSGNIAINSFNVSYYAKAPAKVDYDVTNLYYKFTYNIDKDSLLFDLIDFSKHEIGFMIDDCFYLANINYNARGLTISCNYIPSTLTAKIKVSPCIRDGNDSFVGKTSEVSLSLYASDNTIASVITYLLQGKVN